MGSKPRVLLVGGGHAHLHALANAGKLIQAGAEVTLISPSPHHYYSGMGPGLLSRLYSAEEVRFDVKALITSRGGRFQEGRVVGFDPAKGEAVLEGGSRLSYDLVSFNTGSRIPGERIPGSREAIPVKPIERLLEGRRLLLARSPQDPVSVAIVGGGPAGVELAGNVDRLLRSRGSEGSISLLEGGASLLPGKPPRAGRLAAEALSRRGIRIRTGFRTVSLDGGRATSETGEEVPYDLALLAIGIVPHSLFRDSGISTGPSGGLLVNEHLQSVDRPDVFGGGDCVSLRDRDLDPVGVHAVKEGPVLLENLLRSLRGRPLQSYSPQRRYLLIFNLGDGTGILVWGPFALRGRWAFHLKNRLDSSFMARYRA